MHSGDFGWVEMRQLNFIISGPKFTKSINIDVAIAITCISYCYNYYYYSIIRTLSMMPLYCHSPGGVTHAEMLYLPRTQYQDVAELQSKYLTYATKLFFSEY